LPATVTIEFNTNAISLRPPIVEGLALGKLAASAMEADMIERRNGVRSRTYLGGVIAYNKRKSSMDCHVRNFSPAGAKITFTNFAAIPDQFDLAITRKERSFRARMVWRGVNEAGVVFLDEYDQATPIPLELAKRLRDCEAEKAALRERIAQLDGNSS
jgi:hypothetical protein